MSFGYRIGDSITLRLLAPEPRHIRKISRELGQTPERLDGPSDVEIAFVDLGGARRSRSDVAGIDVRRGPLLPGRTARGAAWTQLVFDAGLLRIESDRELNSPPSLVEILNLVLLEHGVLPVHAASVVWKGRGLMVAGWRGGGKTDALLSLVSSGALLVADEWTLMGPEPGTMRGLPTPVRIKPRHLDEVPALRSQVSSRARRRMQLIGGIRAASRPFTGAGGAVGRVARGLELRLGQEAHADLPMDGVRAPARPLPASAIVALTPVAGHPHEPRRVAFADLSARLAHVQAHHRQELMQHYHEFRYACPDRESSLFEQAASRERALLERLLADVPAWVCEVDRAAPIDELAPMLLPLLEAPDGGWVNRRAARRAS